MNDTKHQLIRYSLYDQPALEKHFEKMASKGWLIEKITNFTFQFRRIKPENLKFTVNFFPDASEFDPHPSIKQKMMEEFASKDGWKLLTRFGQLQVFCNEAQNPVPIETDPVIQVETIYRAMKKNSLPAHLIFLAFALFQLGGNIYRMFTDTVDFLSTPYLLVSLPVWFLIFLAEVNEVLFCLLWYKKARPAAEKGIFVPMKTNYFITATLFLSCAFVLISTILLPSGLHMITLCWLAVLLSIIFIGQFLKQRLKKSGVSRTANYIITVFMTALLAITCLSGLVFFILHHGINDGRTPVSTFTRYNHTINIYDEPMPLYVEDMMEIGNSEWSREHNEHNETFLLSKSEYNQRYLQGGPENLKNLKYTIIDVKLPALYDTVKQSLLRERPDEVYEDFIFTDHYEPVDATLWEADEAYQLHWSDSILDTYLIFWNNRIVEITFYWEPTPEQIAVVVDKLKIE